MAQNQPTIRGLKMKKINRQALSIYQLPIADGQEFYIEYINTVLDAYDNEAIKVDIYKDENTSSSISAYLGKVKALEHIKTDEVYKATIKRKYMRSSNRFSCKAVLIIILDKERTDRNKKKRSSWLKHNIGLAVPIDNFGRNTNNKETE